MLKSVAFICKFGWVGNSTSVINSAIFWESKDYSVDIYCEKPNVDKFPFPDFGSNKIKCIITDTSGRFLTDDISFRNKFFKNQSYDWVIGFDHSGIIRAFIATIGTKTRLIYHSLEFYEPEKYTVKARIIKYIEMIASLKSAFIFAQDKYRIDYLKKSLMQRSDKFRIVYNSSYGSSNIKSSNYFRDLFPIPKQKMILLCVGSLIREHYIIDLLNSLDSWDEKFVLVLHGWIPDENTKEIILKKIQSNPGKVFLSDKLFNSDHKETIFQSCDIGFVGFVPVNNNTRLAAGSAGKIFDFLKSGKPILAYNTPGMAEIIEENEVGVVFDSPTEINKSLRMISNEYDKFKHHTTNCFYKYDFMKQYDVIFHELI